jgi:TonB family protein
MKSLRKFVKPTLLCAVLITGSLSSIATARAQSEQKEKNALAESEDDDLRNKISGEWPEYPAEAEKNHLSGLGVALVKIDQKTGKVVRVVMYVSTGEPILDQAAVKALSEWRFKPGTDKSVKVRISYSLDNGGPTVATYSRKEKSMDEALARYLGKGTVLQAPIPEYPVYKEWDFKEGRGVYELHVDRSGKVQEVKILKSSGDKSFDHSATKTLGKWRLSHGPMIIELPLRFVLTPQSYSVGLVRDKPH